VGRRPDPRGPVPQTDGEKGSAEMITTDELKVQLAEYDHAVKDLEEALAIEASRKRVQELEHTMSRPGFYDDAEQIGRAHV